MRAAFKGIELDANSKDAEWIRRQLEESRHLRTSHRSSSQGILDFIMKNRLVRSTKNTENLEKKLHWTIKPCSFPSNNWYICEKSDYRDGLKANLKGKNDHYHSNEIIVKGIHTFLCYMSLNKYSKNT